jgi:hypothetical protein
LRLLHFFLILPLPVSGLLSLRRLLPLLGRLLLLLLLLLPLPGRRYRWLLLLWLLRLLLQQFGWEPSVILQQPLKQLRQLAV